MASRTASTDGARKVDSSGGSPLKEHVNYEGRVRIEKHKDALLKEYSDYLASHGEIRPVLHDIMQHVLLLQPDNPLEAISSYVRSRELS